MFGTYVFSRHFAEMAVARWFVPMHNSVLNIDDSVPEFRPLMQYFQRSRLRYALTHNTPVVEAYVREFWSTATYDGAADPPVITANIIGRPLQFSVAHVRDILQLGDGPADEAELNLEFPKDFMRVMFERMGHFGVVGKVIKKNMLYGQ